MNKLELKTLIKAIRKWARKVDIPDKILFHGVIYDKKSWNSTWNNTGFVCKYILNHYGTIIVNDGVSKICINDSNNLFRWLKGSKLRTKVNNHIIEPKLKIIGCITDF